MEHAAVLQCCRAAGRGVGGPRVCSQLMLRDAARQDPRPPTHPRTAHSRHTGTPHCGCGDRGGVCTHHQSAAAVVIAVGVVACVVVERLKQPSVVLCVWAAGASSGQTWQL